MTPGTRLGAYEVVPQIGDGGMGEVYRARDLKLGRDVALKVLSASFSRTPDRLARFEREARLLAALNHQHVGAIYGIEDTGETRALVLELVEGDGATCLVRCRALSRCRAELQFGRSARRPHFARPGIRNNDSAATAIAGSDHLSPRT